MEYLTYIRRCEALRNFRLALNYSKTKIGNKVIYYFKDLYIKCEELINELTIQIDKTKILMKLNESN